MAEEILLRVENVSLVLSGKTILRDLNLEIDNIPNHGQVVGLLGPSGIGKTQFFRILSGLLKPTTGSVKINTEATIVQPGLVGVVAQNYPLFLHRTILSNLMLAAKLSNKSEKEAKEQVHNLLERFKLSEYINYYPTQLSGGQRQRIAIAQQLLCSEHFLLMDEPFSGLDPVMNDECCEMLTEVANANELNTIIVITHDIRSALKVSDELWLLGRDRDEKGEVIPGAYVKQKFDLVERGLAWHRNVTQLKQFNDMYHEVKGVFQNL